MGPTPDLTDSDTEAQLVKDLSSAPAGGCHRDYIARGLAGGEEDKGPALTLWHPGA